MKESIANTIRFFEHCSNAILTKLLFRVLFCFLICIIFFITVLFIYPIQFETNDDMGTMYNCAGYTTGNPSPYVFGISSIFLGYIVSGLYRLFPAFPCYAIFYIVIMFISSVSILYCIIESANRYGTSLVTGTLFCILFLCVFAFRPVVLIQFTTVAGFSAAAAIAFAITFEPSFKHKAIMRCAFIAILWFFCYIIRIDTFIPATIILCIVFVFKAFKNRKMLLMFGSVIMFILAGIVTDKIIRANVEKKTEWIEYHNHFGLSLDIDFINTVSAEEIGIEPSEYYAILYWCYLTEHRNNEYMPIINNLGISKRSQGSFLSTVNSAINVLLPYFQNQHTRFLYFLLLAMFIVVFFLRYSAYSEQESNDILGSFRIGNIFLIFIFVVFHSFIAYLCLFKNRFPARVQYMLMLLLASCITIFVCALCGKSLKKVKEQQSSGFINKYFGNKADIFVNFTLILCITLGVRLININELKDTKNYLEGMRNTAETIAMNNPEYFFVYDNSMVSSNSSPFKVFSQRKPVNLMFWGGAYFYSPMWYEQLECNGLDKLDYQSFIDDNVLLMSAYDINFNYQYNPFFVYMVNKFSDVKGFFDVVGEFPYNYGTIYVYKFFTTGEPDNEA